VAVDPATNRVYVSNATANTVSVIEGGAPLATVTVPDGPQMLAFNANTKRLHVACFTAGVLAAVNTETNAREAAEDITGLNGPVGVAINPTLGRLYVSTLNDGNLAIFAADTRAPIGAPLAVGQSPRGVAVNEKTTRVFVAVFGNGTDPGSLAVIGNDFTPPTATAPVASPAANAAGWNNQDVTVTLGPIADATEIVFSATGAQTIAETVVMGTSATLPAITTEGTTVVRYFARDAEGNQSEPQELTVKLDKTPPTMVIQLNGTTVTPGGPPSAFITGSSLQLQFRCEDPVPNGVTGVSGVLEADCTSDPAFNLAGDTIGTGAAELGRHEIVFRATDQAGNPTLVTVQYDIAYGITTKRKEPFGPDYEPVAIRLVDASGTNMFNLNTTVTALRLEDANGAVVPGGQLNEQFVPIPHPDERYYMYAVNTRGLQRGVYRLIYSAGADPTEHVAEVPVRP
jgi:DNA-binding beta-propeller fold protein YncE